MLSSLLSSLITVVLSGCFWTLDSWFFSSPICVRVCSPCSLQVVSFIPFPLPFFYQAALGRMDFLVFVSPYLPSFVEVCVIWDETIRNPLSVTPLHSLTLGPYHMLPYFFLLFPFFPYWLLVPLVFPNAFFASLLINYCCSLWVLLDPGLLILLVSHLCPCLFPLFSPSCILHSLPIAILLPGCFGKNGFPGLCFSLLAFLCGSLCDLGGNHTKPIIRYSVTFPYPGSLPYVTLLAFLLVPNLSPYHLSTTVLLSRSPAFGTEKRAFILFPFFHYLLL